MDYGRLADTPGLDCRINPTPLLRAQFGIVRRYATAVAFLAAGAEILLLLCGVYNFRLSLALAFPILLAIVCGSSNDSSLERMQPRIFLLPIHSGIAGGIALIGIGMHSTFGVVLAIIALTSLLLFPLPPMRLIIVALAAIGPWVTEAVSNTPGTGSLVLGSLGIGVAVLTWVRSRDLETLVSAFALATLLYVGAAVVLFLVGFRADYTAAYLTDAVTSYGPFALRWRMPLSVSWVTVPTVATLGIALCVWVLRMNATRIGPGAHWVKLVCTAGVVVHLLAVVAANGRTQIVAAVLAAVIASGLLPRAIRNVVALGATAFWVAPYWWSKLAAVSESLIVEYLPIRGTAARTASLQGRTIIWDISLDNFDRSSFVEKVSGWGPDGYIDSGAAAQYSGVLGSAYRSGFYPPHNAFLEVFLSGGVALGSVFLAGIVFLVVMQFSILRHGDRVTGSGVAALSTAIAIIAFPEVAVLGSNASPAAVAPLVTLVVLAAYGKTSVARQTKNPVRVPGHVG